ncbi:MAG: hydroxysqualene dehydroxylase HpnE [Lautropia sp.]|nr:hydroxysqualene dehydroxylase HpnE [Lautropia sp.]
MNSSPVLIIGAGWAGLSAAIHLCRADRPVHVLEAAPQAGGRARRIHLSWPDGADIVVDNGQHLLLGAYHETLDLIHTLMGRGLQRLPLSWSNAAGLSMSRHSTPSSDRRDESVRRRLAESLSILGALLHARNLPISARGRLIHSLVQARLSRWRPPVGVRTVADWYRRTRQPTLLIRQFWDPLVISAMNTPPESACATTFLRVLRDALGKDAAASDFVLASEDLTSLFVDPALDYLSGQQTKVSLRTPARAIRQSPAGHGYLVRVQDPVHGESVIGAEQIVLAVPPYAARRLLADVAPRSVLQPLERFGYRPITNAYVGWRSGRTDLPAVLPTLFSLFDEPHGATPAHWFFDRGTQAGWRVGAMVISDSSNALEMGEDALKTALGEQLQRTLKLPPPEQISLIHDKRATFACTPDRPVVPPAFLMQHLPGIALAGDYTYGAYPATLEAAVRSGRMAAELLLRRH